MAVVGLFANKTTVANTGAHAHAHTHARTHKKIERERERERLSVVLHRHCFVLSLAV